MAEEYTTYGNDAERKNFIIHYPSIPEEELAPGAFSHLVGGEQAVVSLRPLSGGS